MTAAAASTDRFARERLAGYDPDVMHGATVFVAGAGALAQNVLINLALSGVGELRIVDFDAFEDHNAPRSPLFPTPAERASLGMRKAPVVATKVHALMRAPRPRARFAVSWAQALGAGALEGVGAVAACVDNPEARAYLGDLCRLTGVTLVEGGFHGSDVSMSVFPASEHGAEASDPCYRCGNASVVGTFSCQRYAAATTLAGGIPAIQSAAATLGGLQAEAIIQALHGMHHGHRRMNLDVRTGAARSYELTLDPECHGMHHRFARPLMALRCTSADSLGALLDELASLFGPGCTVALPQGLVCEAFCDRCGELAIVEVPDWQWRAGPRCTQCGGAFERSGPRLEGLTPFIVHALGERMPPRLREVSCLQAGLPALAIVEARPADSDDVVSCVLAGSIDELFETLPAAEAPGAVGQRR